MKDIIDIVNNTYGFNRTILEESKKIDLENLSLGYCYKSNDIYSIHTDITGNDEIDSRVRMHEYGHIYCGHLEDVYKEMDSNLIKVIESKSTTLIESINSQCNIDYAEELLDRVIMNKGLNHYLHNISMDMEVNSVILDKNDLNIITNGLKLIIEDEINKSIGDKKKLDRLNSNLSIKLIHPEDYEFPSGLSYSDYIILVILNLGKILKDLNSKIKLSKINPNDEDGQSSTENISMPDTIEDFDNELMSFLEEMDHSDDSRDECDELKENSDINKVKYAYSNLEGELRSYKVNNDPLELYLDEIIKKFKNTVISFNFKKLNTHKYNRRILGADNKIMCPSYLLRINKDNNPTIVFGIDVSGSMDEDLVDRCITSIKNQMKRIDPSLKYNIITWNTSLCQYIKNINCNSNIPKITCGGCTNLSGLFVKFKEDFNNKCILIIISDFMDDLKSWNKEESKLDGYYMYGIKYGNYNISNIKFKNLKVKEINDK